MTHRFNIKRFWLVVGLLLLVECAALWAYRSCPRTLPESQCSEVYRRYAHVPGVEAAFVKGFPINDTLGVDVTLLRAADSAGWAYMMEAFHIPVELIQNVEDMPQNNTWVWRSKNRHPEERVIQEAGDEVLEIVILDIKKHEIGVFHTNTKEEESAVFDKKIDSNI